MISSETHTAIFRSQGDDRTSGYMPVYGQEKAAEAGHFSKLVNEASEAQGTQSAQENSSHHFSFLDFIKGIIDIINPLQHIPVISTIYRHMTGDEISPAARIAGDALYGGPIGAAVAVANVAVESHTGKDIGETMFAMVTGDDDKKEPPVQVAQADLKVTRLNDIVWNDAPSGAENAQLALLSRKEFPASPGPAPTKLSYRTGLTGNVPPSSYDEGRAHTMKAASVLPGERPAEGTVNVKTALHSQKAPAGMAENGLPPELIAQKMMAGLEQYTAMKQQQMSQGTYAAF
jgi:hypothetical protein